MSRDTYQMDMARHGAPHIDRYSPQGQLVGRCRLHGTAIKHKGVTPPPVSSADNDRFAAEIARASGQKS
jgi:hypothetical protein